MLASLNNDARGLIMTVVSGIACTVGASIICVDLIVRQFPGMKNFKIEDSNHFLSSGLSLSFGVMIFSSLYSILPSARNYFQKGGLEPKLATFTLIVCFLVGAFTISILSRLLHGYIPHSVVDCDHAHGDEEEGKAAVGAQEESHSHPSDRLLEEQRRPPATSKHHHRSYGTTDPTDPEVLRRPSLPAHLSSKVTQLVTGSKEFCDEHGQCFGYSDPCGQECFRNVQHARIARHQNSARPSGPEAQTTPQENQPLLQDINESALSTPTTPTAPGHSIHTSSSSNGHPHSHTHSHSHSHPIRKSHSNQSLHSTTSSSSHSLNAPPHLAHQHHQHHHHVPTNAFLSIGLQTSIAIALHKIPEGFITYATNHANPTLGFSIFLALFIHNITEGFAMALPLYLALNSRWKAMFWSAFLGGASQPLGAGVAALWFKFASGRNGTEGPSEVVYGCMFAVTAGIMTMVALQLLAESLDLTHSRKLCFVSAFAGMGILGLSSALTA